MNIPGSISDARLAIALFLAWSSADLPADLREAVLLASVAASPVDLIVGVMETLYARRLDLAAPAQSLVGGLAGFATLNGWHGLLDDNRGARIMLAMQRDLGEAASSPLGWPHPETDPPAHPSFAPVAHDPA